MSNRYNTADSEGLACDRQILKLVPIASTYCVDTGKCVIGRSYIPPSPRIVSRDAETLQTALLEPRTASPRPMLARVAGALWSLA